MKYIIEHDYDRDSRNLVGGKALSLYELQNTDVNIPEFFVLSTNAYRKFMEESNIGDIKETISNSNSIEKASEKIRHKILESSMRAEVKQAIINSYKELLEESTHKFVAVRSSATAEDMDEASFAGQQETYLNVSKEEELIEMIKSCWASLFTERAILYREQHDIDHEKVDMAVIVQTMIDADLSGVMFSESPMSGKNKMTIEASWGIGEAIVSGEVTPDKYTINKETDETSVSLSDKKHMMSMSHDSDLKSVSSEKRERRTLSDEQITELRNICRKIEQYYDKPQDIEWAIENGTTYILQSRPVTAISDSNTNQTDREEDKKLTEGIGASPGRASGTVKIAETSRKADNISEGDILVTDMTTPDMVPAIERAEAVITDEGGVTSHASIVSRELGVPAVVGTQEGTKILDEGDSVLVDGDMGTVIADSEVNNVNTDPIDEVKPDTPVKPMTATQVKVNVSLPQSAERAAATGADGVGLLRIEHLVLSMEQTPQSFVEEKGESKFIDTLSDGIQTVAEEFYSRPVRVRTLDAPTDEFRELKGGDREPDECNPMMGCRGIRRSFDNLDIFRCQLEAFKKLYDKGYDNIEVLFPLINDAEDIKRIKQEMEDSGLPPQKTDWGVMIETPSSVVQVDKILDENPDFVSFGTNDLTQYTLAVDRNNELVSHRFDELHPSVVTMMKDVVEKCREENTDISICGEAASKSDMISELVNSGITSFSVNIDAVRDVQHDVKRIEQRMMLDEILDS